MRRWKFSEAYFLFFMVFNGPMFLAHHGLHFPRCQCCWLSLLSLPVEEEDVPVLLSMMIADH